MDEKFNYLIDMVEARLRNNVEVKDQYGSNVVEIKLITRELLKKFIENSLSELSMIFNTYWPGGKINYDSLVIQGAVVQALASQALIEKGREFKFEEKGITYNPPNLGDLIQRQYEIELNNYMEKIKLMTGR